MRTLWIDADDTLWHDRVYFKKVRDCLFNESAACGIAAKITAECFRANESAGSGEEGFASTIRKAAQDLKISGPCLTRIEAEIDRFLNHPTELFEYALESLELLKKYELRLVTVGNEGEQQRKLALSGVASYFDHVHILAQKNTQMFGELVRICGLQTRELIVIGNSVKHDIIPAMENGVVAIWLNHATNAHGRNADVPVGAIEIRSWAAVHAALTSQMSAR